MAESTAQQLAELVSTLQKQRKEHVDAIEKIDATFKRYGIKPGALPRRGRRPGGKKKPAMKVAKTKGRPRYKKTAAETVLDFVKQQNGATTAEINTHWKAAGRTGSAYNTLNKLLKDKKLKRRNIKGARGSKYTVA